MSRQSDASGAGTSPARQGRLGQYVLGVFAMCRAANAGSESSTQIRARRMASLAHPNGRLVLMTSGANKFHVDAFRDDGKPVESDLANASPSKEPFTIWTQHVPWGRDNHGGHMSRPAIVDDAVYVRPFSFSLKSGKLTPSACQLAAVERTHARIKLCSFDRARSPFGIVKRRRRPRGVDYDPIAGSARSPQMECCCRRKAAVAAAVAPGWKLLWASNPRRVETRSLSMRRARLGLQITPLTAGWAVDLNPHPANLTSR